MIGFTSCGFPGPLITFRKKMETTILDSLTVAEKRTEYYCFDCDDTDNCFRTYIIKRDTPTNRILWRQIVKATGDFADGKKKIKSRTREFDLSGNRIRKNRSIYWTWGRGGGCTFSKATTWKEGVKLIKVKKFNRRTRAEVETVKSKYYKELQ